MKTIINLLFLMGISILPAFSQKKVEKSIPYTSGKEIYLNLKYATNIHIRNWDKNEIFVSAIVEINKNANNDNFELEVKPIENQIEIKSIIKDIKQIAQTFTNVQNEKSGRYYTQNGYWDNDEHVYINSGKSVEVDISYDIYVPAQANLSLKTINGNVQADYQKGKYKLETISGTIDFKVSGNEKCNFEIKTVCGDVYTNLNLESKNEGVGTLNHVGGKFDSDLKLNGGGEKISLKTITGNILLRKRN